MAKVAVVANAPPTPADPAIVVEGAIVLIDGRAVNGSVSCRTGGALPACDDERLSILLSDFPTIGDHTLQVATPGGLLSNEVLVRSFTCPEAVSFDAVDCRLGTLQETVASAELGPLRGRLERLVLLAVQSMDLAKQRRAEDGKTEVRRLLRRVTSRMRQFLRRLESRQAEQSIPEEVRTPLVEQATAVRDRATALRDLLG